ncbi:hypothetical protein KDA23_02920 [Candidatus Saccharibacteria bacterium]|nr:hypothetical protein [Candidatus Saccharibacteria bacterium]
MRNHVDIATVFVPSKGMIVARLCSDHWLEYATDVTAWTANWQRTRLPKIRKWTNRPKCVSLVVDNEGGLIVTVLYDECDIVTGKLVRHPTWLLVKRPDWS